MIKALDSGWWLLQNGSGYLLSLEMFNELQYELYIEGDISENVC